MKMMESSNKVSFFKEHPEFNKYKKYYTPIIKEYKKLLWEGLLNGKPYNTSLGSFEMVRWTSKRDFKDLPIDYKETQKEGIVLRHLNEHTDGYKCMLKFKSTSKNCTHKFRTCRHFNRQMASFLKENKNNYKKYYEINKH